VDWRVERRLRDRIPSRARPVEVVRGYHMLFMGRYDPIWPYLSVHVHFPHRTSCFLLVITDNSIYIPIHGTGNRSRWRARGPLSCTHSSRAWCQCRPPRQARVRLILLFFPEHFCGLSALTFRFMGGNSTKATSGINGAGTQTQHDQGIPDSAKIFFDDTKHSVRILRVLLLTKG